MLAIQPIVRSIPWYAWVLTIIALLLIGYIIFSAGVTTGVKACKG